MADYSGYHYQSCDECGVAGTTPPALDHKWGCSVPDKIARARRESEMKRQAEAKQRAEQADYWASLGDDQLITELRALNRTVRDYARIVSILERDFRVGFDILQDRGLANRWLDR